MSKNIDSIRVLRVFENLGYELIETAVGTAIVLDPINAFVFSLVTGSSYLDDSHFPFTVKGLTKLFNAAFSTKPIWGLLDGESFGFTPRNISRIRPYIFDGQKYVVPVDITAEGNSRDWIEQSRNTLKKPEHHLLFRVETWKNGNGMEPLLEYLACHRFRDLGYLVETQVPLSATTGSPDFLAIRDDPLFEALSTHFGKRFSGAHLIELAMLFTSKNIHSSWSDGLIEPLPPAVLTVIGEAKVGGSSPLAQLNKYTSTSFFSQQLALLDRSPESKKVPIPSFFVSSEDRVVMENADQSLNTSGQSRLNQYLGWYHFVAKCYLLVNFEAESILTIGLEHGLPKSCSTAKAVLELAQLLDVGEILQYMPATV